MRGIDSSEAQSVRVHVREEGEKQMQKYLQKQIGNSAIMLVEQVKENFSYGKSQHFTKIRLSDGFKEGQIIKCVITDVRNGVLDAQIN